MTSQATKRIKVSTIILSYNHQLYIVEAIESALRQRGDFDHEIIISDDGSTDGSKDIIDHYCRKYPDLIRAIRFDCHLGISNNYKLCFQEACGEYISILEADDYWLASDKLMRQVVFLRENQDAKMVFSKIYAIADGELKYRKYDTQIHLPKLLTGEDFVKSSDLNPIINLSSVMIQSSIAKELPEEIFHPRFSEITLGFYIDNIGKIGHINDFLSVYRLHKNGFWSGSTRASKIDQAIKIRRSCISVARQKYRKAIELNMARKEEELKGIDG